MASVPPETSMSRNELIDVLRLSRAVQSSSFWPEEAPVPAAPAEVVADVVALVSADAVPVADEESVLSSPQDIASIASAATAGIRSRGESWLRFIEFLRR